VRKTSKLKGEAHINSVGVSVPAEEVIPLNCKCRFKCSETFSNDVRGKICADYYAMGDKFRQKDYLLQRLIVRRVQRRRIVSKEPSGIETLSQTTQISVAYYLEYQGTRHRVCQSFFLKTLCLSNRAVMTATDGKTVSGTFSKMDFRGRQPSVNKTDDEHRQTVKSRRESLL